MEAFQKRHVDPLDFERWKKFRESLKGIIVSWEVQYIFYFRAVQYQPIKAPCSG